MILAWTSQKREFGKLRATSCPNPYQTDLKPAVGTAAITENITRGSFGILTLNWILIYPKEVKKHFEPEEIRDF